MRFFCTIWQNSAGQGQGLCWSDSHFYELSIRDYYEYGDACSEFSALSLKKFFITLVRLMQLKNVLLKKLWLHLFTTRPQNLTWFNLLIKQIWPEKHDKWTQERWYSVMTDYVTFTYEQIVTILKPFEPS